MTERAILIAGGYGVVGQRIAADLAPDYQVIVAGRHIEHAKATAAAIGHGVRVLQLDVTAEASIVAAVQDVATIVSCIDQPRRRPLLHAAIERGLRYTDITPHLVELGRGAAYAEISTAARASGACVVLGTGIVPGISNVMVRAVADSLGGAKVIETSLLLSASDTTGPASFDYFLQELSMPFEVHVNGADRPAHAFSDPSVIEFPWPFGPRSAFLFPFSDQVLYPLTMGAQTAVTRLAIEPARLGQLLAASVRTGRCASWRGNASVTCSPNAARIARRTRAPLGLRCGWTSSTTDDRRTRRSWVARRPMRQLPARALRCVP
jgi:saccharopine dehydrogenase (NAD+, L-lysine-forming)